MKFTEILDETLSLWPEVISIEDGHLIGEEGGLFPKLRTAWDKAEEKSKNLSEWHKLMVWAIYGDLHDQARTGLKHGVKEVKIRNLDWENVERIFSESLFDRNTSYYDGIKSQYENDVKP